MMRTLWKNQLILLTSVFDEEEAKRRRQIAGDIKQFLPIGKASTIFLP